MTPLVRGVVAFLIGFAGALVTIQAIDLARETPDESRSVVVGIPDFDAFCRQTGGSQVSAALVTADAFGWRCVGRRNNIWGLEAVDMHGACRTQFGPDSWAETTDALSSTSWLCLSRS